MYVDGNRVSDQVFTGEDSSGQVRLVARSEYCGQGPGMSKNAQVPTWLETVVIVDKEERLKRPDELH